MPKKRGSVKEKSLGIDRKLLGVALALTILGLIAVADASAPQAIATFDDKWFFFKQQFVWAVVGIVGMFVISKIRYGFWEKYATPIFFANILLLLAVLFPGLGTKVLGARRWLIIGPISIQPSELIKLTGAIYFAKLASSEKSFWSYIVPLGLVSVLVMLQPDLGTTVSFAFMAFVQIFLAGIDFLRLGASAIVAGLAGLLLVVFSDYRRDRLLTYLDSMSDPLGKSYHIRQILLALGSGGLFGVGLGRSRQKFLFLPESATDSIFAVIGEELGFVGLLVLISLLVFFVMRGLKIASLAPDTFAKVLAAGIVAWIGGQALLNMAAVVALVPLTGIPMPFFSYGGSALVTVLFGTGILLSISRNGKVHQKIPRKRR